jgi:outer membrane protein assembly factor BamB
MTEAAAPLFARSRAPYTDGARLPHTSSKDFDDVTNRTLFVAALLVLFSARFGIAADAVDWPSWRGPLANGSIEKGSYPVEFGAENYLWRTLLPGKGCSTPILLNGTIYLTSPADGKDALVSYNLAGAERWRTVFGRENPGKHRNGSGSNASPATDGKAVFVFFKSGAFAAVEPDGKVRWQTDLVERFGKDTLFWDHGTSPVLTSKYVIMARMHQGESWLAAFDKETGELAWKVARDYSTPKECDHGYATPLVIQRQGKESILVWGAEHLTIHSATDGQVSWSCGNFNPDANALWPAIATPVIVGDMAVIAYGRNDRGIPRLHGIRLDGSGDVTQTNHVWKREDVGTFVPTPAVYKGRVILVRDRGQVVSIDPATGTTIWEGAFPKHRANFYASPLVAADKLYAPREDGTVFVASIANDNFELLSENNMGESIIGSPVPVSNCILLRGEQHLFCVASEKSPLSHAAAGQ